MLEAPHGVFRFRCDEGERVGSPVLPRKLRRLDEFGSCLLANLGGGNLAEEGFEGYEQCGLVGELDDNHPEGRVRPERFGWRARGRD